MDTKVAMSLWELLGLVLAAVTVSGTTVAGLILLLTTQILKSPVLMKVLETLADSWPAPTREAINKTGQVIIEATDGIPIDTKQQG